MLRDARRVRVNPLVEQRQSDGVRSRGEVVVKKRLAVAILVPISVGLACPAATKSFTNTTGQTATEIVVTFSEPVRVTSCDKSAFPTQSGIASSGSATSISFFFGVFDTSLALPLAFYVIERPSGGHFPTLWLISVAHPASCRSFGPMASSPTTPTGNAPLSVAFVARDLRRVVAAPWVARSGPDLAEEAALDEGREARPRRSRASLDVGGDLRRGATLAIGEEPKDRVTQRDGSVAPPLRRAGATRP